MRDTRSLVFSNHEICLQVPVLEVLDGSDRERGRMHGFVNWLSEKPSLASFRLLHRYYFNTEDWPSGTKTHFLAEQGRVENRDKDDSEAVGVSTCRALLYNSKSSTSFQIVISLHVSLVL